MKLLPRYDWDGDSAGYLDPSTKCTYRLRYGYHSVDGKTQLHHCQVVVEFNDETEHYLSPRYGTEEEGADELDRIAALISGEAAPAQQWVEGPPPLTDGAWFVVVDEDRNIHVVQCVYPLAPKPWETAAGYPYASAEFTHHLPTPIQPPKETP